MIKKHKKENKGFTMIEMIVATAVFAVVMTISMAAFVNIIDMQRKTASFRNLNDNLSTTLEIMMRDIRSGFGYRTNTYGGVTSCPIAIPKGASVYICFDKEDPNNSLNNITIIYYKKTNSVNGVNVDVINRKDNNSDLQVTSNDVSIDNLNFIINGTDPSQRVIILIGATAGNAGKAKLVSKVNLQTTVAQRNS